MKNLCILGATGSIGTQTLDVLRNHVDDFKLTAVSCHSSYDKMIEIINEFHPKYIAITEQNTFNDLKQYCGNNNFNIQVLFGMDGLIEISSLCEVDLVVSSLVGMIGLVPTITAIKSGKDIALANKETLVAGGELVIGLASQYGVKLLPVDSEHGAIFQCLQGNNLGSVNKLILTASGGPFRSKNVEALQNIQVEDALKHPKWNMGKKISIDSATLMNKGLEVIEAHWLFNMPYEDIQVVIHPQSIIHSMVEYNDGSVIAQMSSTDMRLPIQYALNYPERKKSVINKLDFYNLGNLTFEKPDMETFKCLKLAYEAGRIGKLMPVVLNSANEEAVSLFLDRKIKFLQIQEVIEECLMHFETSKDVSLECIMDTDKRVRNYVNNKFKK